ncbi:ABC transporter ATP-binding protein/permease [Solimonas soli]|uniref:ABC transporter ATP-binding protein/permease n=1 Tax=Solimonas soli TaxID=413479 RepID=UPI000686F533|nr:SbmA/BacA-like family transporter [Solimonas soli]
MTAPDPVIDGGERFGREAWRRVIRQLRLFAATAEGMKALAMLGLLVAALISFNALNVLNSYVGRDFMSAIERRDAARFVRQAWLYVAVFAGSTVVAVTWRYVEERLGLLWRTWQTRQLLDLYLAKRRYYRIEEDGGLQNPDQRIAEDVRTFTTTSLSFLLLLLNASFTIIAFSGVLWSIAPRLFVVAVAYAGVGSLIAIFLGKRLIGLNSAQLDKEANFRTDLILIRDHAATLALMHGEVHMHRRLLQRFTQIADNTRRMIAINRNLNGFTNGYNYLVQIIPALIVAPMFMRGEVQFGVVTQSAMAFSTLMAAFSLAITQFQSISSYAAVAGRLGRLFAALEQAGVPHARLDIRESEGRLAFENLTLRRPDGRVLLAQLTLAVDAGARVLITGTYGHAKVALFKATAGLLAEGEGEGVIVRPSDEAMLFVPDMPFVARGSIRDLLRRDDGRAAGDDAEIWSVLRELRLDASIEQAGGLDVERDWNERLAVRERAALAVVRVLLERPQFVFFDRLSLALHRDEAATILQAVAARGIGYLVLGKAEDAPGGSFDAVLDIAADGRWSWQPPGG